MLTGNTHMDGSCKYGPFCPQSELLPTPVLCSMGTEHQLPAKKEKKQIHPRSKWCPETRLCGAHSLSYLEEDCSSVWLIIFCLV